jgi:hypothetical protein
MTIDGDKNLAADVRFRLAKLREAIATAQGAGLTVEVPELVHLYLMHGTASGAPADWQINRGH